MLDFGPDRQDFRYRAGNAVSTEVDWSIDLTGYSVACDLVSVVTGATVAAITTTITDAAAGKLRLVFPANVVPGTYAWRHTWVSPSNEPRTTLAGYVEVLR